MNDVIYDNIQEMPVDVLKGNIKVFEVFEYVLSITKGADVKECLRMAIKEWKDELARRQPDSLM